MRSSLVWLDVCFGLIIAQPPEVSISAQIWRYPRISPLLDGLFQDVAATQVSSLSLNPNAVNGANLDALQQSFQVQLQYNQLAGIQNSAAAQTINANAAYQNSLVQMQSQLLQTYSSAQTQLAQAQAKLDTVKAAATSNPDDLSAATLAVTTLSDTIAGINNQTAAVEAPAAVPAARSRSRPTRRWKATSRAPP